MERFEVERCYRCNRRMKAREARIVGYGKVCWRKTFSTPWKEAVKILIAKDIQRGIEAGELHALNERNEAHGEQAQ